MQILHIDLRLIDGSYADLRYGWENPNAFESRRLPLAEIQDLIDLMEVDYYLDRRLALPEDYVKTGRRLYAWLDGSDRWLAQRLDSAKAGVVLAIATSGRLSHLPWEVLHDGSSFLVARAYPVLVPVRWQGEALSWCDRPIPNRPLQTLFMATSPEGVTPVLSFEAEEGRILEATKKQPLTLTVEESGCLDELENLVASYDPSYFDVVHLTGHADIANGEPLFITESETGNRLDSTPQDIAKALQFRFPSLLFLSGCRTGQSRRGGEVLSMAATLLNLGAKAVLGWARPVLDTDGILAAEKLYAALAAARALPEALALTYQAMIAEEAQDWHLLRLYVTGALSKNLVTPMKTRGRQPVRKASMASEFLDVEKRVKVPTRGSFIGRRRPLQNCLRALQDPDRTGVLLHGMGGLGKSSLAARLCDRLPDFERVIWFGPLDEAGLLNRLAEPVKDRDLRQRLQDSNEDLKYRLLALFEAKTGPTFLLVLDDFEANLEAESLRQVKAPVAKVLGALLWAIESVQMGHKVLITCRYDFDFTGLATVYKQPLAGLKDADLQKKCQQLWAFGQKSVIEEGLRNRAIALADRNPRLLEWLNRVLQEPSALSLGEVLDALEGERQVELREKVLAQALLAQIDEPMRAMLTRARVYELPVPKAAIVAVCGDMADVDSLMGKAVALGLLEQSPDESLRVPRVLSLDLIEDEELAVQAAKSLYQIWWEEAESPSEVQVLEIYRLAILEKTEEIAANITTALANQGKAAILHQLAGLKTQQGDVEGAITFYQQSLEIEERIGNAQDKATTLHQLADLKAQQGDVEGAIAFYQQSLEMTERIGNAQDKATTLHQLAGLKAQQGDVVGAIALYQQSLEIQEQIGNAQGKAATLHRLADLKAQQGDVEGEIALYQKSLEIQEQIGDAQGKAATLHQLATLKAQQGDVEGAIALFQQSLEIQEQIGNAQGKATTLGMLGQLLADQKGDVDTAIPYLQESLAIFQRIGSPNAQIAQDILDRIER